ncbi:Kinesin-like protein [Quillaja saponaria]|uniref:Kinesin-like protein n=1 Tax=Quillaja saponaria TaxID=32244 RepID=A0AAD7PCA5_QUISA|nr:Kinesin-like protein [Quillaja saponaria]
METLSFSLNTPKTTKSSTPAKPLNPNPISKVRVIARVRPFLSHEISERNGNPVSCISVIDQDFTCREEVDVHLKDPDTSRNECYRLDSFFGQEDNNVTEIFCREVNPLIPEIFGGSNVTVFAYGATGSGKTYTMQGTEEQSGLMTLAMSTILSICHYTGSTAEISYYEVYMNRCYDLLEVKAKEIAVLDDKDGQIHLRGLSKVCISSLSEFREVFTCGVQRRKVAHTGLNDVSSRSHGVLVIAVSTPRGNGNGDTVTGKLNLIDLAGNEDNRRTCNEGIRLQESAKINQSLFALSNVISALNNNKPRVPYRESKLTRILQDSLGGTSRALMVACLNPGEYQESVHTVSLAAQSRKISNFVASARKQETPKVKVDMKAKLEAWLESKGKTKSSQRIGSINSPFLGKTPNSLSCAKKLSVFRNSVKGRTPINNASSNVKERAFTVAFRNLFNNEGPLDVVESQHIGAKDKKEKKVCETVCEPNKCSDKPLDKEENLPAMEIKKVASSPISEYESAVQSPLSKALSPININVNQKPFVELLYTNKQYPSHFDMKTPKKTVVATSSSNGVIMNSTPLDKFSTLSSSLKNCLVQEYIDFLNDASREELIELKGIGDKLAEYIVDLRETSPIRTLGDLEKIGLSSKQAHNLFNRAVRTLFDKPEDSTACI